MIDLKETVVLYKGEGLAIIGYSLTPDAGVVFNANLRDETQTTNTYPTAKETWKAFEDALEQSTARGWKIAHRGAPNFE